MKQESVLLSSDDTPSDEGKVSNSEETNLSLESDGIGQQGDEASGEDKILGTEDSSLDGTDATENISSQSDPETPESEKIIYESRSLVDSSSEVIDSQSSNLAGADNPTSEDPDSLPNTEATNVSDLKIQANGQKIDTVAVVVSVFSQSDSTSDPHTVPLDDMGTAFPTVTEDLSEVNGTPEYLAAESISSVSDIDTAKERKSLETPWPESTYWSKNERDMNIQEEFGDSKPPWETPNGGSAFSSAGIPAPSISFQVNPGKVLVTAAADQAQCQAFAALQILKVILFVYVVQALAIFFLMV